MDCFEKDWFNIEKYDLASRSLLSNEGEAFMHSRPNTSPLMLRLRTNSVLSSFFGAEWENLPLDGMKELLLPLYKALDPDVLSDVYGQDIYNLVWPRTRYRPITSV